MADQPNFAAAVGRRAAEHGARTALIVVTDSAGIGTLPGTRQVTYSRLDRDARVLAAWLQAQGAEGERVLIAQTDPVWFAVSFLACLYCTAVAVPVPVGGPSSHEQRLLGIARDSAARFLLSDRAHAADLSRLMGLSGRGAISCLAVDVLFELGSTPEPGDLREPHTPADAVALLQYTSGATRDPRGVVVTHANLIANQEAIRHALGTRPDDVIGGWLPLFHDLGLIGQLLHPLWLGACAVLTRPQRFARRPDSWLRLISEHSVTISGAPDSAYELCVQRIADEQLRGVDLSRWRIAVSGAERIRPQTLRAFLDRFGRLGLAPEALYAGYGLAEATLLVSFGPVRFTDAPDVVAHTPAPQVPAAETKPGTVAASGRPLGAEVLIVDPDDRRALPEGRPGEIWLRGPGVAGGYWRRILETGQTFGATVADGRAGFLRTGDLGLLRAGELYVTGRLGEALVIDGRNLHPQDLEHVVRHVSPLFGPGVVFPVRADRDHVVVVQEVRADPAARPDLAALAEQVRARVRADFDVPTGAVLLVRPGTVRRTSSGKLERAAVRRLFLEGRLEALYEDVEPEVRGFVRAELEGAQSR